MISLFPRVRRAYYLHNVLSVLFKRSKADKPLKSPYAKGLECPWVVAK